MEKKRHASIDEFYEPEDLKAMAVSSSNEDIRYDFSEKEITDMKAQFFELNNYQAERTNILDKIKRSLNEEWAPTDDHDEIKDYVTAIPFTNIGPTGLKKLKIQITKLLLRINQGYEIREEKLYCINYSELGLMAYYNAQGFFMYQRQCYEHERQSDMSANILKMKKSS